MKTLFIFGLGYTSSFLARACQAQGWRVIGTTRDGRDSTLRLNDRAAVLEALKGADFCLVSIPPQHEDDLVLTQFNDALHALPWIGYLSATSVYGDCGGAWVDETSPIYEGRNPARTRADRAWQALAQAHIFRLPGIYGPGRSALDRVKSKSAHRIDKPGHVFCRIHVADIIQTLLAAMNNPQPGIFNISDDVPSANHDPIEYACDLLGAPYPPLQALDDANLSPMARTFYEGCRRVDNTKIKRDLGVRLRYSTYKQGLRGIWMGECE